ncbi:Zinc finger, LSD1-type [Dillenia turbinata]|uniref:Zinc finger, LSD1-type n=1 Tax=Dillenia turbinata TaxID=194707 RepID=A0AAN8VEI5_9MAGN
MQSAESRSVESKESEKAETPIKTETEASKITVENSSFDHSITAQMEERKNLELDLEKRQQEGMELEEEHVVGDEDENEDDDDGPPPGWESQSLFPASPSSSKLELDFEKEQVELLGMELEPEGVEDEAEEEDDDDDGPPPGWESHPITYPPSPSPSPHSPLIQTPVHSSPKTPDLPSTQTVDSMEMDEKHVTEPKPNTPPAHEVGQVKCGNCEVLLMYRYGAPSVRCSSCRFVTEIGITEESTDDKIYRIMSSIETGRIHMPEDPIKCSLTKLNEI